MHHPHITRLPQPMADESCLARAQRAFKIIDFFINMLPNGGDGCIQRFQGGDVKNLLHGRSFRVRLKIAITTAIFATRKKRTQ